VNLTPKKPASGLLARKRHGQMKQKREVIELVRRSPVKKQTLGGSHCRRNHEPCLF
jgi:hypothetical protein